MATTARDLVKSVLKKIHVLGTGQSLDATEAEDALASLNDMLAFWAVSGNVVFTETKETFNLTSANSYTIGTGGDFNTDRFTDIKTAFITSGGTDHPLLNIGRDSYFNISSKGNSGIPDSYYFDGNYPLGTLYLYPKPAGSETITLIGEKELTSFASLDTEVSMPPEYKAALIHNGAVWVASDYEKEASATVKRVARETLDAIEVQNTKGRKLRSSVSVPASGGSDGDIMKGYWG